MVLPATFQTYSIFIVDCANQDVTITYVKLTCLNTQQLKNISFNPGGDEKLIEEFKKYSKLWCFDAGVQKRREHGQIDRKSSKLLDWCLSNFLYSRCNLLLFFS